MRYMTRQRRKLLETLEKHRDETLCADQIVAYAGDEILSRSAIYRNLSSLESEGYVKRIVTSGKNKLFYRYIGSDECKNHIHLECSKCGKTFHLDVPSTNTLIEKVMQDSDFKIDIKNTVLHGICGKCHGS